MRKTEITDDSLSRTYLKNYENRDKKHPRNSKYDAIENFKGIVFTKQAKDKRCILIWLLLLISLGITVGLSARSFFIQRVFKPMDFRGDICGESYLKDKPKIVWANPMGWGVHVKSCVAKCPLTDGEENCLYNPDNSLEYSDYCYLTSATKVDPWFFILSGFSLYVLFYYMIMGSIN